MTGGRGATYYNNDGLIVDQDDYHKDTIVHQDDLEKHEKRHRPNPPEQQTALADASRKARPNAEQPSIRRA